MVFSRAGVRIIYGSGVWRTSSLFIHFFSPKAVSRIKTFAIVKTNVQNDGLLHENALKSAVIPKMLAYFFLSQLYFQRFRTL